MLRAEPAASHDVQQLMSWANGVTPVLKRPDIRFFFASLSQHRVASIAGLFMCVVHVSIVRSPFVRRSQDVVAKPLG